MSELFHRLFTSRLAVHFGSVAALIATVSPAAERTANRPLEPEIAAASSEPAEVIAGIRVKNGWRIDLFAAEPDVANIVAFDVDHQGRLYVCETFRQTRGVTDNRAHDQAWVLADLAAQTVQDRIDYHKRLLGDAAITYAQHDDRIRRITDTNGDGVADESIVVASGFNKLEEGTGAGVLVRGNDVFYSCIPKLWKLVDQDGDGKTDQKVVLSDGYGVRVAFRGHDLHGLIKGPDGRLYFTIGDRGYHVTTKSGDVLANPAVGAVFRCEEDGSGLEIFCNGLRNPQELAFNDVGDFFTVDNNSDSGDQARIVHLLQGGDSGWRMYYQYLPDRGPFNRERIWYPHDRDRPAYTVPPVANFTDGPSGLAYYPGTGFGDALNDTFLICDFRGGASNSGIRSFNLQPSGATYSLAGDDQPIWTVLATDVAFGPDGSLFVSDWVDGWDGLGKGRVYRISDPKQQASDIVCEVKELLSGDWQVRETADLISNLSHVDRRIRLEAHWELARRGATPELLGLMADPGTDPIAKLHAVWAVGQIARNIKPASETTDAANLKAIQTGVRDLLKSDDDRLRAAAANFVAQHPDAAADETLIAMLSDSSARVQYFACLALGASKVAAALPAVNQWVATNDGTDPAIRHAAVMFWKQAATAAQLVSLKTHPNISVRRAAVVALRAKGSSEVAEYLKDGDSRVVLEAARAIHDVPLSGAMTRLANLIDRPIVDDALLRRVLNANYRRGRAEHAAALAKFAAGQSAPAEMRIEALEMLGRWVNPDPRDRVLNDYRPLTKRDRADAMSATSGQLDRLLQSTELVREKTIEVASKLGLKQITPMLIRRVADLDRTPAARATALDALGRLAPGAAVAAARQAGLSPPTLLTEAALRILSKHAPGESLEMFVAATKSPRLPVKQLAWDILAERDAVQAKDAIAAGVQGFLDGALEPAVLLNVLEAAAGRIDADLQQQLTEHQADLIADDPLAAWLPSLAGGIPSKGEKLFFEKTELSCVRCHKVDRAGGEVGPELTIIGKEKDPRYLLEAICLPDASIAEGYETAVIANEDGQILTGIVKTENDEFVELVAADGSQVRVFQDEIVVRRKGKSSMPADLVGSMTARELRDLVAYLTSLKVDPRQSGDVE